MYNKWVPKIFPIGLGGSSRRPRVVSYNNKIIMNELKHRKRKMIIKTKAKL